MVAGLAVTELVAALLAWAHAHSLVTFYAAFVLAGLAMAATLYEPAFAVTAAWFTRHRARAVLVLTIAGAARRAAAALAFRRGSPP